MLTSEVLHKILQFHLALRLHIGAVHVRVEEDDGEGQDEDSVWVSELAHHSWVADAVPLADGGGRKKKRNFRTSENSYSLSANQVTMECSEFSPESLDETFDLLRFPLNSDVRLEFPESFVQLHP